ncbi:alkylhydroperoxidase [Methylobacterium sp. Leaf456]|uniref:carboxymuconolactone decarboxylase family protein n=1 Tax=Methylobacterium sp. Leaf456 TaxID=1736382 RepID=UPI0007003C22|nr:carboxymuconolactone decarboxylase family protein [Methylobacterium sp. Leaf456]KQT61587.1 alkylhydroperoxidase [Methylobacterium sp. Leaf456]
MTPRIGNPYAHGPAAIKAMMGVEASLRAGGLEHGLLELVKLRASQINGCAYCIALHVTDARKQGEGEMRLHLLNAWRESRLYSERERAALAWTEALTRLPETGAPDADYDALKAQFTEAEQVQLTLQIGAINLWNRLQVGLRGVHEEESSGVAA